MISLGHFLPGGELLQGEGVNETYRGMIEVGPERCSAYVKLLPDRQLVNELLASVLGRLAKLPVPRGFLVTVRQNEYPSSTFLKSLGTTETLAFAVESLAHKSLLRRLDLNSIEARRALLCNWPHLNAAAAFDDWIANADRHPGNLLVGGPGEAWLIDHSHAFTGDKWLAAGLIPTIACGNQLCAVMNVWLTHAEKMVALQGAHLAARTFFLIDSVQAALLAQIATLLLPTDLNALTAFVGERCATIPNRISAGLGIPSLPLESQP